MRAYTRLRTPLQAEANKLIRTEAKSDIHCSHFRSRSHTRVCVRVSVDYRHALRIAQYWKRPMMSLSLKELRNSPVISLAEVGCTTKQVQRVFIH